MRLLLSMSTDSTAVDDANKLGPVQSHRGTDDGNKHSAPNLKEIAPFFQDGQCCQSYNARRDGQIEVVYVHPSISTQI
jgi:hypothetical protein